MEEEIKKIKEESEKNNIPIIMNDTLEVIKEILLERTPKKILEIGSGTGYSSICFANILSSEVKIDTIELDEFRAKEAIKNISKVGLEAKIHVLIGDAVELLADINGKYDIIFIDAAKSKYPIFLTHALRLTDKGSIIIADNVLYKGYVLGDYNKHKQRTAVNHLREYLKNIEENPSLDTEILDVGDGLAISHIK